MALTKEVKVDKIEIVGDFKAVQCREATVVSEDGVELTRSFHRHVLHPDSDISGEPQETQDVCNAVWTDEVKAAWDEKQLADNPPVEEEPEESEESEEESDEEESDE